MLKIIHGADFHLDSPFAGLSPERAAQRRGEQRELLDRLAGLAREKQADLVLQAGDLLDSEREFRETAQALDVDEDFSLVVRTASGAVKTVRSGEVSVRGMYGYTE